MFILLSGHGSRQPDHEPFDEPDGFDEVFFPADTEPYDPKTEMFPKAIVDDELHDWVNSLAETGASVCVIVDACHSGTMLRGEPDQVVRGISLEHFASPKAVACAVKRAHNRHIAPRAGRCPLNVQEIKGHVVGIYASRGDEDEVELPFSKDGGKQNEWYGLLSYTLCQVLTSKSVNETRSLTYREAVQHIQQQYMADGRQGMPTPLVEGPDADREICGVKKWPGRSQLALRKNKDGHWTVNAGQLHGISKGSILRAFTRSGDFHDPEALGYVEVLATGLTTSSVEPVSYGNVNANERLPQNCRCELAFRDFGNLKLRIAVQATGTANITGSPSVETLVGALQKLAISDSSLPIEIAKPVDVPDWRLCCKGTDLILSSARRIGSKEKISNESAFRIDSTDWEKSLSDKLRTIVRAEMLKRVAFEAVAAQETLGEMTCNIDVAILKYSSAMDRDPKRLRYSDGLQLYKDDLVAFEVTNRCHIKDVYITILFLDSAYGITCLYPTTTALAKSIAPGKLFITARKTVSPDTLGAEYLIVIATKAVGAPIDFSWLGQFNLVNSQRTRGGEDVLKSPLERLFDNGVFGANHSIRGLKDTDTSDATVRVIVWNTNPTTRPKTD